MAFKHDLIFEQSPSDFPAGDSRPPASRTGWFWPMGFFVAVVLSRGFSIFCNQEINVDESLMLEQAMRYQNDLVPWRSVDGLTSGPINTWALLGAHWLGMPLTFSGAHVFAAGLLGAVVGGGFLLAQRSFGRWAAIVGAGTALVWLACNQAPDLTHYSSELVPIALLTGALLFLTAKPSSRRADLVFTALGGGAIGLMPWAKLQSAPIAGGVFLWFCVFNFWIDRRHHPLRRAIALAAGAILPATAILSAVIWTGVWPIFWRSYIISNLGYAGQKTLTRMVQDGWQILLRGPIGPWLLIVFFVGTILFLCAIRGRKIEPASLRLELGFAWLLLALAGFVCVRPATQFLHYSLFLLLPLILATASLARASMEPEETVSKQKGISKISIIACVALWLVYGGWHARLTRWQLRDLYFVRARCTDAAAVLAKVRAVAPQFQTLEVWGWFPSIYVKLGQPAPTRYGIPHMLYAPGPSRDFLRQIYLHDLIQAKPDVVVKMYGATDRQWTNDAGFFPELTRYIDSNYGLRWSGQTSFYQETAELAIYVRRPDS